MQQAFFGSGAKSSGHSLSARSRRVFQPCILFPGNLFPGPVKAEFGLFHAGEAAFCRGVVFLLGDGVSLRILAGNLFHRAVAFLMPLHRFGRQEFPVCRSVLQTERMPGIVLIGIAVPGHPFTGIVITVGFRVIVAGE